MARAVEPGALGSIAQRDGSGRAPHAVLFWLGLLTTERAASGRRFRGARFSGWFVALSGVGSVGLAVWIGAGDVADVLALRVLAYAAWLYALIGLPALLHPDFSAQAVSALSRLRGVAEIGPVARGLGLFVRLSIGLLLAALPGVILAAFSSDTASLFLGRAALILASTVYLLLLAGSLAVVGVLAERWAPRAPRRCALALVVLPFLLGLAVPAVPSIPGVFFWAFEQLMHLGGYLG